MKTLSEKLNEEYNNKLFKNSRGAFVHIKLLTNYTYRGGEKRFDMCEGKTKEEAINRTSGPWAFTKNIYGMIKKGTLIPC